MKTIVISPYSNKRINPNPKDYIYWPELISFLEPQFNLIQIGVQGEKQLVSDFRVNLKLKEIFSLISKVKHWLSVDNFLPHMLHYYLVDKSHLPGIVLFSVSDPNIYGYTYNLNILKDRKYLRKNQFDLYYVTDFNKDAFLDAQSVCEKILSFYK